MDRKKSILNVTVSVSFQIITMVMGILLKRMLIQYCGNEYNGLNSLYLSIIGLLSVTELGVGGAITYAMYRPIVEGNTSQVSALYHLFNKLYRLIGGMVFLAGILLIPFLPYFAADYAVLNIDFAPTFFLVLVSAVLTYLFGAKTALHNAYKNNYITTAIQSIGIVIQYVLQALSLVITQSFICYLVCKIVAVLFQWIVTHIITKRKYNSIIETKAYLELSIKKEIIKNVRALFMHKIGAILVGGVDSIVISTYIGIEMLGRYSNYTAILYAMSNVIVLVFSSLVSILGHMYASAEKEEMLKYCNLFHMINFCIATVFCLGYFAVADNIVAICFSPNLLLDREIVFTVSLMGFVQVMRKSVMMFKDATGTFYNDRWKPLFEGLMNFFLSVFFVKKIGISGVIIATVMTDLLICHIVEPYVLYKYAFSKFPTKYYIRNYSMILVYVVAQLIMEKCIGTYSSQWRGFFFNGIISVSVSVIICIVIFFCNKELRVHLLSAFKQKLWKKNCREE